MAKSQMTKLQTFIAACREVEEKKTHLAKLAKEHADAEARLAVARDTYMEDRLRTIAEAIVAKPELLDALAPQHTGPTHTDTALARYTSCPRCILVRYIKECVVEGDLSTISFEISIKKP